MNKFQMGSNPMPAKTVVWRQNVRLLLLCILFLMPLRGTQAAFPITPLENPMSNHDATASQATENFYSALNVLFTGDAGPMKAAWSHSDDITYMGPEGAYLRGWDAIGPLWDEVAALKLGGHVSPKQMHIVTKNDLALISCIEAGANVSNGTAETVDIRSSTVFRLEDGDWKVIHHQTDKLNFLDSSK
jgi:ketosteroid isomerase-like protein